MSHDCMAWGHTELNKLDVNVGLQIWAVQTVNQKTNAVDSSVW